MTDPRHCPGLPGHPPGPCAHPPEPGDRYCAGCRAEFDAMPDDWTPAPAAFNRQPCGCPIDSGCIGHHAGEDWV